MARTICGPLFVLRFVIVSKRGTLRTNIRAKIVELLDQRNIKHSSIDLARFSWVKENVDEEDEENADKEDDEDTRDADSHRRVVTTPVTIWVGVLPDTLTGEVAFQSSNDILDLLKKHGISNVDIAYRESAVRALSGPELFAPVPDRDPLKAVIDPVTTALGLPIAGLKTLDRGGTLGFYFRERDDLYGVTARHVLFHDDEGNNDYTYKTGPKKEVVLMGTRAFEALLTSTQGYIGTLNETVLVLETQVRASMARSEGGGPNAEQAAREVRLSEMRTAIQEVKKFYVKMEMEWKKPKNRIIGHVVWAPSISVFTAPQGYTRDVCVIKLDKKKFWRNFKRNVLDLGVCSVLIPLRLAKGV